MDLCDAFGVLGSRRELISSFCMHPSEINPAFSCNITCKACFSLQGLAESLHMQTIVSSTRGNGASVRPIVTAAPLILYLAPYISYYAKKCVTQAMFEILKQAPYMYHKRTHTVSATVRYARVAQPEDSNGAYKAPKRLIFQKRCDRKKTNQ